MKKSLIPALAMILVTGMILISCAEPEETPEPVSPTATTPTPTTTEPEDTLGPLARPPGGKEGGRLQLVGAGNISNLGNPNAISNPYDAFLATPCIESLFIIGADGNLKPWLAERFEIARDGSYITFYLRKGVKFHDGTDFNAEACKYNLDNGIYSEVWPNLKTCESAVIIDDYTVRLNFKEGKFDWGAAKSLAGFFSCRIYSPKSLQENDDVWKHTHVVGTGPFKLVNYKRDQLLEFERFDDYWRGTPYLDGIDIKIIPQLTTRLLAFKSGEAHLLFVLPNHAQGLLEDGFTIIESTDMIQNLCLIPSSNNPDSPFANVNVRRAIEHAIDKQALVDGLTYGYGRISNQVFLEFQDEYDPNTTGYPYDPERAKELLAQEKYAEGFTTSIWLADFGVSYVPEALQDMLSKVNITLNNERIDIGQLGEMVALGGPGWEGFMFAYSLPGTKVDPTGVLLNGPLSNNTTWISCNQPEELLELTAQGAAEIDPVKRSAIYREISRKMTDDYCMWIFMYWTPTLWSVSPVVKGHTLGEYSEAFVYTFAWLDD